MILPHTMKIRIYYEDTDAGGVVYYANYLKYFERGRTELLRSLGFTQSKLLSDNIAFAVKNINVDYKKPAVFDDMLIVKTSITKINKVSLVFNQTISTESSETNGTICDTEVKVVSVSVNEFKITPIPQEIITKLNRVNN